MKILYRLGYYLVGLSLGLIIVSFVFSGKKTSCNYGPNARVLADLRKKQVVVPAKVTLHDKQLDSVVFHQILQQASIDFSQSNTRLDSCKIYFIQAVYQNQNLDLEVENCQKVVRIIKLQHP